MVGGVLFLQSYTLFSNSAAGGFLNTLQQTGFFSYVIPFLLIFALVFGILTRMGLFKENKAVVSIIALAVGLMALQLNIVPQFFSQIFPRFGIAISIILVLLIISGLFMDPKKPGIMIGLFIVALIIVAVVLVQSAGVLGSPISTWIANNWGTALGVLVIGGGLIGAVIAIISSGRDKGKPFTYAPYMIMPQEK